MVHSFDQCPSPPLRWWTCQIHIEGGCTYPPILLCPNDLEHEENKAMYSAWQRYRPKKYAPTDRVDCHPGVDPGAVYYPPQQPGGGVPCINDTP
jgi:hypothetical protein